MNIATGSGEDFFTFFVPGKCRSLNFSASLFISIYASYKNKLCVEVAYSCPQSRKLSFSPFHCSGSSWYGISFVVAFWIP